jgi:hypothetical protein
MKKIVIVVTLLLVISATAFGALTIKMSTPTTMGGKSIVKLQVHNTYSQSVQAIRAGLLLMDDQGKVVGHDTKWIVGGPKVNHPLVPDATTSYNFIVDSDKPFIKTQLMVERIVLENGKLGNPLKDVVITNAVQ